MKKIVIATIGAFALSSTLVACSWETESKSVDEEVVNEKQKQSSENDPNAVSKEEEARIKRMEKGILVYGEGTKGGLYLTTVNTAYSERIMPEDGNNSRNPYMVVVSVKVANVSDNGKIADLSELRFNLNDSKTDKNFEGRLLPDRNPMTYKLEPNNSLTLDVSFEVPTIEDKYMFNIESKADPITDKWEVTNLNKFKQ
ncbi:hypothetical protein O0Q50_22370 [Priestia aryabhattai]|uniref:DUF4352 domain-containing protein n=1 Tax=Priestia aryabhattai TaxID=412384 RepID=A0AAX6NDN5_PRIAR|nr:hypothetical protein [Priestia aryabhattai]MDU9693929.1 hypothetical protein [Priestia aryabhattai]NGY88776.1 hypothetical protein [Priestia megaterium]